MKIRYYHKQEADKQVMVKRTLDTQVKQMRMSDLSRESGFSVSTVYDYLRSGLLQPAAKESPTKSYFTESHLLRLKEIRALRNKGVSLSEIKKTFGYDDSGDVTSDPGDDVRVEIIDKALELFSLHHYENTKISDITHALNMGNGTFYRYFNSKEELFLDCLERLPKVLVPKDAWAEVEKEKDYIQRLRKRGYAMLNAFPSYIGILNYAKLALGGKDERLAKKAAECINSLVSPLADDLRSAIEGGFVREVDVEMCAYLLLGINETFGYLLLIQPDYSIEDGFAVIEDFIAHALMRRQGSAQSNELCAEVTDSGNNVIDLEDVRFDGEAFVAGKYLEGELQIPLHDVQQVAVANRASGIVFDVTLKKGGAVQLGVDDAATVSGGASFGRFIIPVKNINSLHFS